MTLHNLVELFEDAYHNFDSTLVLGPRTCQHADGAAYFAKQALSTQALRFDSALVDFDCRLRIQDAWERDYHGCWCHKDLAF